MVETPYEIQDKISNKVDEFHQKPSFPAELKANSDGSRQITKLEDKKRRRGKRSLNISDYRQRCLNRIAELERRMAFIDNNRDAQWKKLRCQKIAYEKRLRDRNLIEREKDQISLT